MEEPRCTRSRTERLSPQRARDRRLRADPRCTKSRTETLEPKRLHWKSESALPAEKNDLERRIRIL